MRFLVLALFLVASLAAETQFSFEGNLSKADVRFRYRSSSIDKHDVSILGVTLWCADWVSSSVEASSLNKSASADVLAGAFIPGFSNNFVSVHFPPVTVATYVSGRASIDFATIEKLILGTVDASVSMGAIAFAIPGFAEVDKDNNILGVVSFSDTWEAPQIVEVPDSRIKVVRAHFKNQVKADIDLYIVSSSVAGYLNFASTPVSPNTLEVIVKIRDFKYSSPTNHIELVLAGLTVNAEGKGSVGASVDYRKAGNDILSYAAVNGKAFVDNKQISVSVSSPEASSDCLDITGTVKTFIKKMVSSDASFVYRRVAFPAGAKDITYDPAIGSGDNIYDAAHSSASRSLLSVALVVFALLACFF